MLRVPDDRESIGGIGGNNRDGRDLRGGDDDDGGGDKSNTSGVAVGVTVVTEMVV